MKLPFGVESIT